MLSNCSPYGNYRQLKFSDVYNTVETFLSEYNDNGIPTSITDNTATTLYYLLYAKYGNSTIASSDINQFKYRLFAIIFQSGPAWEKKLEIQKKFRELTEDEIIKGSRAIYNEAYNPGTTPSTADLEELNFINGQKTTNYKKSKMEAYALLYTSIVDDVTEPFLRKFKKLFLTIVEPELPLWYVTEEDDNETNI